MKDFDLYLKDFIGSSKELTLLLDYDGTLAPIASHPNLTAMADETKAALNRIAECPNVFTAAISGRGVDDVKKKIGIDRIVYAGNHGLEILYPNGTRYNHQVPVEIAENYEKMVAALEEVRIILFKLMEYFPILKDFFRSLEMVRGSKIRRFH